MNMSVFWYEWVALVEAAENMADRERQLNAQSDRKYEQIRRDK
jgi:hypothetical protein